MRGRLRPPSTESLFVATIVLFGFRLGAHPIGDNSMFAHLRTGIDIAKGLGIPRHDPYSFTAHGHQWVVQSWLAEWTYGVLHQLGGFRLVILEQAALMAVLAWLIVQLARGGTPLRTALAGSIAVGAGAAYWTQRPLLFGLIALALTVLAVERRWNPWWLVPIVWVWVNTHGSFPLGIAFLVAYVVGEWLDNRPAPSQVPTPSRSPVENAPERATLLENEGGVHSLRYLGAFVVGLAASVINPLGPRLLTFALNLGGKRDVFRDVIEWRSPDFQRADGLWTLGFLAVALLVLFRTRVAWRHLLPLVGFLALALIAVRNVAPAAVVLAPAVGAALRVPHATREPRPSPVNVAFVVVLAVAYLLFAVSGTTGRLLDLHDYPVAAVDWMDAHGLRGIDQRVAHNDVVGDYLILRNGRNGRVFADDRFDMYPVEVTRDVTTLIHGGADSTKVLDRWRIETVLWDGSAALPGLLTSTGKWRQVYKKSGWVVLRRA